MNTLLFLLACILVGGAAAYVVIRWRRSYHAELMSRTGQFRVKVKR